MLITSEIRDNDIEKIRDENRVVVELVKTLANISQDENTHGIIIKNGIAKLIRKFVDLFMAKALPHEQEIDMVVLPIIALDLVQSLAQIIFNISQNAYIIKQKFVDQDIIPTILKFYNLKDYQVRVNLIQAMACLITSDEACIRNKCVGQGILQKMLEELQLSNSHKIKRISKDALL